MADTLDHVVNPSPPTQSAPGYAISDAAQGGDRTVMSVGRTDPTPTTRRCPLLVPGRSSRIRNFTTPSIIQEPALFRIQAAARVPIEPVLLGSSAQWSVRDTFEAVRTVPVLAR
jgi:hypothetical protein